MGFGLAQELDREGHHVSVVDPRPDRAETAHTRLDVMAFTGSGCSREVLCQAGAEGSDLLIAVSGSDEVNIVSCLIARELGVPHRVARIESPDLSEEVPHLRSVLGVDEFINPRRIAAERLHRIVSRPGITESAEFADGRIVLTALRVDTPSPLTQATLAEIRRRFVERFVVTAVRRRKDFVVPTGSFRIEGGDIVYVVTHADMLDRFLTLVNPSLHDRSQVFTYGASVVALHLCRRLSEEKRESVLLDDDPERCGHAADQLRRTSVVRGSPLDRDLMIDLNISQSAFLGLSESTEANVASALMAKRLGARRAIVLVSQPEEAALFDVPPVDAVVCPMVLSVGAILRSVRAGRVISLFKLAGNRGEALEIEAREGAPAVGRPLRELQFPSGAVVAAVHANGVVQVASGETVIQPGDHVIVVTLLDPVHEVIRLFSER
jgi:trk system potassium uptake protein TrkA